MEPLYAQPADITGHGLTGEDARAVETISLFVTYLGRVAGDMALTFMSKVACFWQAAFPNASLPR